MTDNCRPLTKRANTRSGEYQRGIMRPAISASRSLDADAISMPRNCLRDSRTLVFFADAYGELARPENGEIARVFRNVNAHNTFCDNLVYKV